MLDPLITFFYALALVFLVGLTMWKSRTIQTKKETVLLWALFGFVANFITLSSYYTVLPLEGVPEWLGITLATFVVSLLAATCGALYSLVGLVAFETRCLPTTHLFAISFSVVVIEVLRAYVLPIPLWGGGSLFGAHGSSWTYGEVLSLTPLLSFAQFGGTYILAGLLIFTVGVLVYPFSSIRKFILITSILFISFLLRVPDKGVVESKELKVAIVQTAFGSISPDQDIDVTYLQQVKQMRPVILSLASTSPDIIVLPEDSRFIILQSLLETEELRKLFPHTLFIDGATQVTKAGRKNRTIFFDAETNTTAFRDKGFLFPFGEYMPYGIEPVLRLFVESEALSIYKRNHEYTAGSLPYSEMTRFGTIGTLICSELTSFASINALRSTNPDIVFAQSSLTWLHNKPYFIMGHIFSLKVISQVLHKPIISVANDGPSIVVNLQGDIIFFKEKSFSTQVFGIKGNQIRVLVP